MDKILQKLNINEELTKKVIRPKVFSKVKDNVPHIANYNFMADTLRLPKTKEGFEWLLVVVDLATDAFDMEPLPSRNSQDVVNAMLKMFKRPYIKRPYASIRTDQGTEFEGVFNKWMETHAIAHKLSVVGRHQQTSNVESLNRQLGRLFNGYMNAIEEKTRKQYNEWLEAVPIIRKELNALRKKPEGDPYTDEYPVPQVYEEIRTKNKKIVRLLKPKYNLGDIVIRISDFPLSALNKKQSGVSGERFREGDLRWDPVPRKVVKVLSYSGPIPFRYVLDTLPNVSYTDKELKPSTATEQKYVVKDIIGKKGRGNQIKYKVWFKGEKKSDAQWIDGNQLLEDVPNLYDYPFFQS